MTVEVFQLQHGPLSRWTGMWVARVHDGSGVAHAVLADGRLVWAVNCPNPGDGLFATKEEAELAACRAVLLTAAEGRQ